MIYKRGTRYWFKFQCDGRMLYFPTGQGDARAAMRMEAKKRTELAERRQGSKEATSTAASRLLGRHDHPVGRSSIH